MKRTKFNVAGENFNGKNEATVVIEQHDKEGYRTFFRVRPKYSREEYTLSLGEVAARVIWAVERAKAGAK